MKTASLVDFLQTSESVGPLLAASVSGPNPRPPAVYKQVLPRAYKLPAIAVHRYGATTDQDMSGPINVREDNFQLDIYGDTQADCDAVTDACRTQLTGYTGTYTNSTDSTDTTVIVGSYLDQDRDMPFLPNADTNSLAFRSLLGFRIVSQQSTGS